MSEMDLDTVLAKINNQFNDIFNSISTIKNSLTETKNSLIDNLNWQGWTPESGLSKVDHFNEHEPDRKCTSGCEKCGFHYLSADGCELEMQNGKFVENKTPLCGVW